MKVPTQYKETDRYHRFEVKGQTMNGRIYILKTASLPPELTLELSLPSPERGTSNDHPLTASE